jgi:hypothetical protein
LAPTSGNVGIGTTSPGAKLSVQGTLNVGINDTGYDVNFYGATSGSRMFWDESKMALRTGIVTGTQWDDANAGLYSFSSGQDTTASGSGSFAVGFSNGVMGGSSSLIASNSGSIAMGRAYGSQAVASITSSGIGSFAAGYSSGAFLNNSNLTSSGDGSIAMGYAFAGESSAASLISSGTGSIAMGLANGGILQATQTASVAIGENVQAIQNNALAFGKTIINNTASSFMVGFSATPALTVLTSNVGIGTTNPLYKLEVNGTGYFSGSVTYGGGLTVTGNILPSVDDTYTLGDDTHRWSDLFLGGETLHIGASTANEGTIAFDSTNSKLQLNAGAATPSFVITSGGNVGIGTTSPSQKLDVQGGSIAISNSGGSVWPLLQRNSSSGGLNITTNSAVASGNALFSVITSGGTENLTVLQSGNVGIGTTSPDKLLTVYGSVNGETAFKINNPNTGTSAYSNLAFRTDTADASIKVYGANSGSKMVITADDNMPITFETYLDGSITEKVRITNSGNVGIGTTNPNNLLQVANLINFDDTDHNTKIGYQAGANIVSGAINNTFIGYQAGLSSAGSSTAAADSNTAVGYRTLYNNTTGAQNAAIGGSALYNNTTGYDNMAIGTNALLNNSVGFYNTALGTNALRNSTGNQNSAMGLDSLYSNTSGGNNVAIGMRALRYTATGSSNTAIGVLAGQGVSGSSFANNTFIGFQSGYGASTGGNNVELGYQAGYTNSTGEGNVFLGYQAGYNETGSNKLYIANSGTTSLIYGDFSTGMVGIGGTAASTNPYLTILAGGNVGIGTTRPIGKFEVATDGASQVGAFSVYSDTASNEPIFYLRRGRGTLAVPAVLQDGDIMGTMRWAGQFSTSVGAYTTSAKIEGIARGTFAANNAPTDIAFYTTPASSATPLERMRILSGGNVGIGTTNPGAKLYVVGGITASGGSIQTSSDLYTGGNNGVHTNYIQPASSSYDYIYFKNYTGDEKMRITTDGNVGIGTTSPDAKLNIAGDYNIHLEPSSGGPVNYYITTNSANNIIGANIRTKVGTWNVPNQALPSSGIDFDMYSINNLIYGGINFGTRLAGEASNTLTSRMVILNNGNVGIGTTSPSVKLQSSGSILITGSDTISTGAGNPAGFQFRYGNTADLAEIISYDWAANAPRDFAYRGRTVDFRTGTYGNTSRLYITNDGNVGIGTTSPGTTLDVNGEIRATGQAVASIGTGVEISYASGSGYIQSFDRTAVTNKPLYISGSTLSLNGGGEGNVGIGTTNPGARLEVSSSPGNNPQLILHDAQASGSNGSGLGLYNDWTDANSRNWGIAQGVAAYGDFAIRVSTAKGGNPFSAGTSVLYADKSGSVGIGTTEPSGKLEVAGTQTAAASTSNKGISFTGTLAEPSAGYYSAGFNSVPTFGSGSSDMADTAGFYTGTPTKGTSGTITNNYGILVDTNTIVATNKYGLFITAPTGGTAKNVAAHFGGNVGIGTTEPDQALDVIGTIQASNLLGGALNITTDANGNIIRDPSDRRLKENIQTVTGALDKVMRLRGVTYNWRDKEKMGSQTDYGMIAQEVAEVTPELTATSANGIMGVKYTNMVGLLVNAVQEQETQISGVSSQVGDLNLRTSQNVETVRELQNSVDQNLVVISNNFSKLDSQISTLDSNVAQNTSDISALTSQISSLNSGLADISRNLSQLTDTVNIMTETESMIVSRIADHETRIAALETEMLSGTTGVSGSLDLSPALKKFDGALAVATGPDGKNIFTLNGELDAKVLGAESLKLGSQTSGRAKILAGENEIMIPTTEVKADSKIYVTPLGSTEGKILYVAKKEEDTAAGESFKVKFDGDPAAKNIEFNWLIVN